jgi:hypothetical protein
MNVSSSYHQADIIIIALAELGEHTTEGERVEDYGVQEKT